MKFLILGMLASMCSFADSKSEALLREKLAASEAARLAVEKDKANLAAALKAAAEERKKLGKQTTSGIADISEQAAVNAEVVRKNAEAQAAVAATAKTLAERTAKSSEMLTHPLWATFGIGSLTAVTALLGWLKTRKLEKVAEETKANVLKIELSINSRMDAFLKVKDDILEATKKAASESEVAALAKGAHDERVRRESVQE